MSSPVYLTIDQVADLLGTTATALYSQRHASRPPGSLSIKVGRRLLWRRADIDGWLDSEFARNGVAASNTTAAPA